MTGYNALQTRSINVGGARISVTTAGPVDGEPILLIHGYPQTSITWRKIVEPLTGGGYRLIMPDYRGAGGSSRPEAGYDKRTMANDMAEVARQLGVTRPLTVVGHDLGATIAYAFAREHPRRARAIVIMDALLAGTDAFERTSVSNPHVWHFHFHQAPDLPEALTTGREALYLSRFLHDSSARGYAIDDDAFAEYVRNYSQPGAMRAGFALYRAFDHDGSDNARWLHEQGPLQIPLLAMTGANSSYSNVVGPMAEEVARDVSLEVIPDAGHWLPEENPEAVAKALASFIERSMITPPG